jgi:hypothetical protein
MLGTGRLHLESEADRFSEGRAITLREDLSEVRFQLERESPGTHVARVRVEGPPAGTYELRRDDEVIQRVTLVDGWPSTLEVPIEGGSSGTLVFARVEA